MRAFPRTEETYSAHPNPTSILLEGLAAGQTVTGFLVFFEGGIVGPSPSHTHEVTKTFSATYESFLAVGFEWDVAHNAGILTTRITTFHGIVMSLPLAISTAIYGRIRPIWALRVRDRHRLLAFLTFDIERGMFSGVHLDQSLLELLSDFGRSCDTPKHISSFLTNARSTEVLAVSIPAYDQAVIPTRMGSLTFVTPILYDLLGVC